MCLEDKYSSWVGYHTYLILSTWYSWESIAIKRQTSYQHDIKVFPAVGNNFDLSSSNQLRVSLEETLNVRAWDDLSKLSTISSSLSVISDPPSALYHATPDTITATQVISHACKMILIEIFNGPIGYGHHYFQIVPHIWTLYLLVRYTRKMWKKWK